MLLATIFQKFALSGISVSNKFCKTVALEHLHRCTAQRHKMFKGVLIFIFLLLLRSYVAERLFCPPYNFVPNADRPKDYSTAIISEVHGKLWVPGPDQSLRWTDYLDGHVLARNLYFHVGVLGIDKVYLTAFYNETLYPSPPPIEAIFPPQKFCVVEWYKLGVLEWLPQVYPGPAHTWALDKPGKRTKEMNLFKSQKGYNVVYEGMFLLPLNILISNCLF